VTVISQTTVIFLSYNLINPPGETIMPEDRKLHVFLCHSSNDKPAVRKVYQRLKAEGWIDPWLDEEKLFHGQDWDLEIEKTVEVTDACPLISAIPSKTVSN
jgi:hypothetical protein